MPNAYIERRRTMPPSGLDRDYAEYLRDKRVVIVGPSDYLEGAGQGPEIDSYDVIVRLNLDCPIRPDLHARIYPGKPHPRPDDVGSRTDVLYHCLYSKQHASLLNRAHTVEECAAWMEDGLQFVVGCQDSGSDRMRALSAVCDVPIVALPRRSPIFPPRPNTGVMAIAHLLSLPVRSLHVTGFSFYASGGYRISYGGFDETEAAKGRGRGAWGQVASRVNIHPQEPQIEHLRRLWESDPRLTFDATPAEILGVPSVRPPTITALVPMKGASERVPGKNTRDLAGKPLLYWTLAALHEAKRVAQVVVDTDSQQIAALVRQHHPQTTILMRPDHLRDGAAVTGNDLIEWEMSQVDGEHFGQFHVTSPLLTPQTIDRAIDAYFTGDGDSLMTVTEHHFWLFRADGTPVNSDTRKLLRSQDLEPLYEDNNAAHLFSRESFAQTGSRIGERVQMFPISKIEATDIDYEDDFEIAEALMARRLPAGKARSRRAA